MSTIDDLNVIVNGCHGWNSFSDFRPRLVCWPKRCVQTSIQDEDESPKKLFHP